MALTGKLTYQQPADGKAVIFLDGSDYAEAGVDPNDYVRTVEVWSDKDATGTLITTLTFSAGSLEVSMNVTEDKYYSAKLNFSGSPTVPDVILNIGATGITSYELDKQLAESCGSCSFDKAKRDRLYFAGLYRDQAINAVETGNSAKFNEYIKMAMEWLQQKK